VREGLYFNDPPLTGIASSPPLEERIEVRRDLNLFRAEEIAVTFKQYVI
jgi:hypothetical protein